ncbi:hypothetical protein EON65_08855 [archaeon]|nr:MAG: hypothetical protein EON65_08855 [archaeon]
MYPDTYTHVHIYTYKLYFNKQIKCIRVHSTNMLEVSTALVSVCKLVTVDMIPAVSGDVINLLGHEMEVVRKKAVAAMHR